MPRSIKVSYLTNDASVSGGVIYLYDLRDFNFAIFVHCRVGIYKNSLNSWHALGYLQQIPYHILYVIPYFQTSLCKELVIDLSNLDSLNLIEPLGINVTLKL